MLKDLGFLTEDGTPTPRYHEYRNPARSKQILADALREAYTELFHINEKPTDADRDAIQGAHSHLKRNGVVLAEDLAGRSIAEAFPGSVVE